MREQEPPKIIVLRSGKRVRVERVPYSTIPLQSSRRRLGWKGRLIAIVRNILTLD